MNKDTESPYGVICPNCGPVTIELEEYTRQMMAADALWYCPVCGATAEFDDDRLAFAFEQEQGQRDIDDDQDEDDAELFRLQQYEGRIEAERRQDAQVSRAAADYLAGGN